MADRVTIPVSARIYLNPTDDRTRLLWRKIREHPASYGGTPDETFLLDLMEGTLSLLPDGLDLAADHLAWTLERRPEEWPFLIERSQENRVAWKALKILLRGLYRSKAKLLTVPVVDEKKWQAGLDAIRRWAYEAVIGDRKEPAPRGRVAGKNGTRNSVIIGTLEGIHTFCERPYMDDYKPERSACGLVADRLGIPYATIRTIWRKNQSVLRPLRKLGLTVPLLQGGQVRYLRPAPATKDTKFLKP